MSACVYLIPVALHDEGVPCLDKRSLDALQNTQICFAENPKTTRAWIKKIIPQFHYDSVEWIDAHQISKEVEARFIAAMQAQKNISILSESGCPCVADPGSRLVALAHQHQVRVIPFIGPNSILLALMASGLNGQHFQFNGYLPIKQAELTIKIKELEKHSRQHQLTQIFIETPYRNDAMFQTLISTCLPDTQLCIAVNITSPKEWIKTQAIHQWKKEIPHLNKQFALFLFQA